MSVDDETWARELVQAILRAERLGGGFRIYHETAVREICAKLKAARDNPCPRCHPPTT